MGREVRRVPADWAHPKDERGHHIPLHDGLNAAVEAWDIGAAKWAEGLRDNWRGGWEPLGPDERDMTYAEWSGERPDPKDYMPDWPAEQRTHVMMYEDTSEGTPISPAFASPEELGHWLAATGASAFGDMTASYEGWLRVANGGFAPSAVIVGGNLTSGVDGDL